jgi:hypothetical protein
MNHSEAAKKVRELLDADFWIQGLAPDTRYARLHDDHDGKFDGWLSVTIGDDGDAWVDAFEPMSSGLRFRMPVIGGGASPRVRNALLILAEAIRLDNELRPQRRAPTVSGDSKP